MVEKYRVVDLKLDLRPFEAIDSVLDRNVSLLSTIMLVGDRIVDGYILSSSTRERSPKKFFD